MLQENLRKKSLVFIDTTLTNNSVILTPYRNHSSKRKNSSYRFERPMIANNAMSYALDWSGTISTEMYSYLVREPLSNLVR